jgi:hypothetical protein
MAEMLAQGKQPEVLFWVGCAGSLMIEQKNNKSICTNFESCKRSFAVLGTEESCTGDPAKEQEMSSCSKCKR